MPPNGGSGPVSVARHERPVQTFRFWLEPNPPRGTMPRFTAGAIGAIIAKHRQECAMTPAEINPSLWNCGSIHRSIACPFRRPSRSLRRCWRGVMCLPLPPHHRPRDDQTRRLKFLEFSAGVQRRGRGRCRRRPPSRRRRPSPPPSNDTSPPSLSPSPLPCPFLPLLPPPDVPMRTRRGRSPVS